MTSHVDYIADQDLEQLQHLIDVSTARMKNLTLGEWIYLWRVADNVFQASFAADDYVRAVAFLTQLGKEAVTSGKSCELSLERTQYRRIEAERYIAETNNDPRVVALKM